MDRNPKSKIQNTKYRKILLVRTDRIGDVALSTPAIKAVHDAFPDSRISVIVRPYAREVVDGNPYIEEVIVYDKDGADRGITGMLKFASQIRRRRFDLAVVLHPAQRAHLAVWLAGIPSRLGYGAKWGFLNTKRIPHTKQFGLKHEIDYVLDLLRHVGVEARERKLHMPMQEKSERKVKELFAAAGISGDDAVVTINPGASCPSKRWPAERFASLAGLLIDRWKVKIVLISDEKDKAFADRVASALKGRSVNLAGMTSVSDIASVLKRSKLFISNDSGPVHIACAVGAPVIAIFGRNDRGLSPRRWGPSGSRDTVIHKDVGCGICLAHNCGIAFKCLEAVTVDDVAKASEKILEAVT